MKWRRTDEKVFGRIQSVCIKGQHDRSGRSMIIGSCIYINRLNSLVNDIFMPVLSIFTGKIDFSNMFIALDGNKYPTLAAANEVTATINYGSFITQAINFFADGFWLYLWSFKGDQ